MKKKVKWILLGVVALAAIGGTVYTLLSPTALSLTEVSPKTAELSFTVQGSAAGERVIQVYSLTSGTLLELRAHEGQRVRAGDVICVVDPEPIQERINQVNSTIRSYEAQQRAWEEQSQSQNRAVQESLVLQSLLIEQSRSSLDQAKRDLERAQFLYEDGSLALVDVEQAQALVTQYELALQSNQQQLSVISASSGGEAMRDHYQAMIDIEKSNLLLLENELKNAEVTAVSDGVITALPAQDVSYVSAGAPVAELTVTEQLRVEAYVSTDDIDSMSVGDEVHLTLSRREGDIEFPGRISHIYETAELTVSALGLEERRVKVEISPDISALDGANFGAGYDVDVQFLLYSEEEQLTVPKTALFKAEGKDMVWVSENGRLRAAEVETGIELRTEVVILSGLSPGSLVVTDSNESSLKDGLRVAGIS